LLPSPTVAVNTGRLLDALLSDFGREILVALGHDTALVGGGPIAAHRLNWRTATVRDEIIRRLQTVPGGL